MLKALELVGFKSFADKTRFEFPPGITVIVGPNGSGKSNIVDAVKWVLGEQSIKSLRGKEMADVIFNGSHARRGMNSAEITLTFDNSNHLLPVDTPEVHITRRVYRGGEGEYLINRQPSRLRDIRDILSGTGMGTQAYSVIEQGKVDVLLQSSARDRRVIFEEAAGISLFKIKKLEALRRLERVDQNLLRLSDIVDEVDNRLRTVRLQATKARRYKEYTDRLQELRTQVGLVDWRRLTERLSEFERELAELGGQRDAAVAETEAVEARLLQSDTQTTEINEAIRSSEAGLATNREQIASYESTLEHERRRIRDLEEEAARHRRQLTAMSARAGDLQQQLLDTCNSVDAAQTHHQQLSRQLVEGERKLTDLIAQIDQIRGENEQRRAVYLQQMRAVAALGNETSALQTQLEAAQAARQASEQRLGELDAQLDALGGQLQTLRQEGEELAARVSRREDRLSAARATLEESCRQLAAAQDSIAQLRQRHSGIAQRAALLEDLQKRCEGLGAGVKDVLARSRSETNGPFGEVRGLVADLLRVSLEAAPLIEVALGTTAQQVVVGSGGRLLEHLKQEANRLSGRVGLLWLGESGETLDGEPIDLEGRSGVLGRGDRFVETDPEFASLAKRLLGRTWLVERLDHALTLRRASGGRLRFVTLAGELLDHDGTLCVGPNHASTGLISRRSELRVLQVQLAEMEAQIQAGQSRVGELARQVAADEKEVQVRAVEHQKAVETLGGHQHKITAATERRIQLDRQRSSRQSELEAAIAQHEAAVEPLSRAQARRGELETGLAEMEGRLAALDRQIDELETQRQTCDHVATGIKVELAKSEERLRNLEARMRQFQESQQERQRAIAEDQNQLAECQRRAGQSEWAILQAESEIAQLYLNKENLAGRTAELVGRRDAIQQQRGGLTKEVQHVREKVRKLDEKIHAKDLAAGEIRHERSSLADRLREDYGIELGELEGTPSDEEQHRREEVQAEIEDLRRKINNLGNVNLEALAELDELDGRHQTLADQYKDLTDAKRSLEQIIEKINGDSRQLFSETFQTVRGHFQNLFRDLFGGGHADIILEENEDILESGIEILARPPGKEPRSISLLSGGEKTLTCVALLLAIFRSRPSPFCVLDEVDAALDEANIDRFTKVLQDFLAWTQFIIVTHSKKTMTCANTIYGVTMQESGVSKQVSVRFEDVSDDGQIRAA